MKEKILIANWKMNLNVKQSLKLGTHIAKTMKNYKNKYFIILPSFQAVYALKKHSLIKKIKFGSQDCSQYEEGSYTGDVSADMVKELGCEYSLIGHSERRIFYNEDNKILKRKLKCAQDSSLKIIFCIGEDLKAYKQKKSKAVLKKQLSNVFPEHFDYSKLIIAYEPVWAIGKNRTPEIKEIDSICYYIKKLVYKKYKFDSIPVLYGGSVNSKNSEFIFYQDNVNGALVGGASLKASEFKKIYDSL